MATDLSQFVASPAPEQGFADGGTGFEGPQEDFQRDLSEFVEPTPEQGIASDIDLQPFTTPDDKSLADELVSGTTAGVDQLQASLFGLSRLIGRELDLTDLEDFSDDGINRNLDEAQRFAPSVQGFSEIESFDDFTRWAAGTLGNALPSLSLAIAGGGIGGIIGKKAVEGTIRTTIMNRMTKNLVAKGLPQDVAESAAQRAVLSQAGVQMLKSGMSRGTANTALIQRGFTRGANIGIIGSAGVPIAGDTDIALQEAGIDSGFTSIVVGLAGGALEILPVARLIDRAFPGVDKRVAKNFIKDFAVSSGTQALLEGGTEAAQEVVQMAALAYHDPNFDMLDPTNVTQVINAFAAGALVGAVTGGGADIIGQVTTSPARIRDKVNLSRFKLKPESGPAPDTVSDFVPADTGLFEEVKDRVNSLMTDTLDPVFNTVRDQVQSGIDAVADSAPALNARVSQLVHTAREAQEEFLEGHKPVIEDIRRFAKEQIATITEEAQSLFGDERKAFVEAKLAEVKAQVNDVAADLKERANKIVDSVSSTIDGQGIFDDEFSGAVTESDTEFLFGKSNTERDQAQGFKDRKSARQKIDKLRKRFPSATDSTFGIREQEDGTFLVALDDSGQAEALREDEIVTNALDEARKSARRNPNKERQAKVQQADVDGQTNIDVPTLVFAGRRLDAGDNQTVAQAFAAITGRLLERGTIGDVDFQALQEAFDRQFPAEKANENVAEATRLESLRVRDDRGQRLAKFTTDPQEQADIAATVADRAEIQEESLIEGEPTEADRQAALDDEAAELRRQSRPVTTRKPKKRTAQKPKKRTKPSAKLNRTGKKVATFMPGVNPTIKKAIQEISDRVAKLLSDGAKIRIINEAGAKRMIEENHPHAGFAQDLLDHGSDFVVLRTPDKMTYILTDNFENPGRSIAGLIHELGHAIHYDTWQQLSKANQDVLWKAFQDDVKSGKRTTGAKINRVGQNNEFDLAAENVFEFKEWMADQFVDWMNDRKAPRTAIEKFLESVAAKMDQLWEFISANPGRYNQLNETYAQFADAVAFGLRTKDPTGNNQFFKNEGAAGRPIEILFDGQGIIVPDGASRTEWNAIKERLTDQYPVIAARAKLMSDWMRNAYQLALAPSTSVMRTIGEKAPAALKLVSIFNREPHGKAKRTSNYHQRLDIIKGQFLNKFDNITKGMTDSEKSSLLSRLRALDGTDGTPQTRQEKAIRKLFDEMHEYLRDSGLPVGNIQNYFPRIWSREKLINNQDKIITHLMQKKMSREDAQGFFNSLIAREADEAAALRELQQDELSMQSPSFRNMRSRTADDKFFNQFFEDNLDAVVGNYIVAAAKRGEFNRALGSKAPAGLVGGDALSKKVWNSRGKVEAILAEAKEQGATPQELLKMKNYVDANLGMYGRDDVSDRTRSVMAAVVAYQNMRTLMFTVFASLPDLVGPAIRAGDLRGSFKTSIKNIREIINDEGKFADMARAWGQVSSAGNQSVLTEYVDNHYMPPTLRKWNDAFFTWTGLNYYTDFTRKMALAVGVDTIKNEAHKVNDRTLTQKQRDRAKQFLAELGLTSDSVDAWVSQGERTWGGLGYDQESANDQKVAEALVQFVNESIMRPNASQRPILASHPAAMLVFHLKGFIYAIHDTVLKRLVHNFGIADTPAQVGAAIAPAILMIALTAFGLELRELITGGDRTDRMDGWEYTWTVVERSGLLGISQLGFDFEGAGARGQSELVALGGPTIGQLADLISKPVSQTIPKGIPIVSQLPWARDALRESTPL